MRNVDPEKVGSLLRKVATSEILPRHRSLAGHEIFAKPNEIDPDDIVTEADFAVERWLGGELEALLPGSVVVGEEAATVRPALLAALAGDAPVWVLDPLDGTKNFAAGSDAFGTMLALVRRGETLASWIHLTVDDRLFVAERGAGAFADGVRLDSRSRVLEDPPAGTLYTAFMPPATRAAVASAARGAFAPRPIPGSAAIEYTNLVLGRKDFAVYFRLHPWDHAPGALLLAEAGGAARHPDGRAYRPTDAHAITLVCRDAAAWETLRARLGLSPEAA
ncbi:Fructose-1, 6-bisphosphatase/inositol-1-monophosphatase [Myxococcaceae bacterium]|jgi:fructose-1,6-bisphosphatase/inositol monophosphatase family enzyme|nr:Fructose-1, 6-bisphosphatase/inositol-1-monophosphatase [Myxococcaceae bacterium]